MTDEDEELIMSRVDGRLDSRDELIANLRNRMNRLESIVAHMCEINNIQGTLPDALRRSVRSKTA